MATRTKSPGGIVVRHSRACRTKASESGRCNCSPSYEAWISSRREGKRIRRLFSPAVHGDAALAAAKNQLNDWRVAQDRGGLQVQSKDTVRQAGEAWVAGARQGEILGKGRRAYKPSAVRGYEIALRRRVYPEFGDIRLSEITVPMLQRFVNRLIADGANASTINNTLNPLRAIYRHAISEGRLAINPTTGLQLPSVDGRRERTATPAEANELLSALPDDQQALWATAFYSGLRRGELRALRAGDVDVRAGTIAVKRSWDDEVGVIDPKSRKGTRDVPIPAELARRLASHLAATGRRGDDLIFGRSAVDAFVPNTVRRTAERAWAAENEKREERKLPALLPIGLHEARHTYVTFMYKAGLPLETIGDFVGHASTYMTDRYRHLLPDAQDEAREKMDAYLAAAKLA